MITPEWLKDKSKDREWASKIVYAKEAALSGYLVYSVKTNKWYTPDEFMQSDERISIHRGEERTEQFKVVDPEAALLKFKAQKTVMDQYIEDFTIKIKEYKGRTK